MCLTRGAILEHAGRRFAQPIPIANVSERGLWIGVAGENRSVVKANHGVKDRVTFLAAHYECMAILLMALLDSTINGCCLL